MTEALKIVFMGTPEFACPILSAIHANGHEIPLVVTVPDKPAGRGMELQASPVKKLAENLNIPIAQPEDLNNPIFINQLANCHADIIVVVAFRKLPESVWKLSRLGTFNLHASLLPQYRGAAPINWAIINGDSKTGLTTFLLDNQIDTGKIIIMHEIEIEATETAGSLHNKLMLKGPEVVLKTIQLLATNKATPQQQPTYETLKGAPKLNKTNTHIDWSQPGKSICSLIRGLSPYPAAWTTFNNEPLKIYSALFLPDKHSTPAGTLLCEGKTIKVASPDGWIHILELQPSGKSRMPSDAFINGHRNLLPIQLL